MDSHPDMTEQGRWLTYAEIAKLRGIARPAQSVSSGGIGGGVSRTIRGPSGLSSPWHGRNRPNLTGRTIRPTVRETCLLTSALTFPVRSAPWRPLTRRYASNYRRPSSGTRPNASAPTGQRRPVTASMPERRCCASGSRRWKPACGRAGGCEALRRAEDGRQGRGLLARLGAALRGEDDGIIMDGSPVHRRPGAHRECFLSLVRRDRERRSIAAALAGEIGAYDQNLDPPAVVAAYREIAGLDDMTRGRLLKSMPAKLPDTHPVFDKVAEKIGLLPVDEARSVSAFYNDVTGMRLITSSLPSDGFADRKKVQVATLNPLANEIERHHPRTLDLIERLEGIAHESHWRSLQDPWARLRAAWPAS